MSTALALFVAGVALGVLPDHARRMIDAVRPMLRTVERIPPALTLPLPAVTAPDLYPQPRAARAAYTFVRSET